MLSTSFVFSILLQLILPVMICYYIIRRYHTEWRLCLVGSVSYLCFWVAQPVVSQLVEGNDFYATQIALWPHVWIFLFEGLVLALVEQAIRAGSFWYARARVREWGQGLTVSAGQATLGLLLVGLQLLLFFVSWATLTSTRGDGLNLTADELANLMTQLQDFWALPWHFPLLVAVQSLVILFLQFALGMMVWQAINHKAWIWLGAAVLWETALNTLFKVLALRDPDLFNTSIFVLTALVHAGFLYLLNRKTSAAAVAISAS